MSMLAERRRKTKWVINPSKKPLWATNDSGGIRLGKELMEKMGWSPGKGLGLKEQGMQEPLKVSYKSDTKGMGFKGNDEDWIEHQDEFNSLLSELTSSIDSYKTESGGFEKNQVKSLEEKSRQSRARVHYQKFTRGKDLSRYSENDLACILGTIKSKRKRKKEEVSEEEKIGMQEVKSKDGFETSFGVTTINSGSISDYFKKKWVIRNKIGNDATSAEADSEEVKKNKLEECDDFNEVEWRENKKQSEIIKEVVKVYDYKEDNVKSKKRKNESECQLEEIIFEGKREKQRKKETVSEDTEIEKENQKEKKKEEINLEELSRCRVNEESRSGDENQPYEIKENNLRRKKEKDKLFKENLNEKVANKESDGKKKKKYAENFIEKKEKNSGIPTNEDFPKSQEVIKQSKHKKKKKKKEQEEEETTKSKKRKQKDNSQEKENFERKSKTIKFEDEEKSEISKRKHEKMSIEFSPESEIITKKSRSKNDLNEKVHKTFPEVEKTEDEKKSKKRKVKNKSEKLDDNSESEKAVLCATASEEKVGCEEKAKKGNENEHERKSEEKNPNEEKFNIKKELEIKDPDKSRKIRSKKEKEKKRQNDSGDENIFEVIEKKSKLKGRESDECENWSTEEKKSIKKRRKKEEKKREKEKTKSVEITQGYYKANESSESKKILNTNVGESKREKESKKKKSKDESIGDEGKANEIFSRKQYLEQSENFKSKISKKDKISENICGELNLESEEVKPEKKKSKKENESGEKNKKKTDEEEWKVFESRGTKESIKLESDESERVEDEKSEGKPKNDEGETESDSKGESLGKGHGGGPRGARRRATSRVPEDVVHSHKPELFREKAKKAAKLLWGAQLGKFKGANLGQLPGYGAGRPPPVPAS